MATERSFNPVPVLVHLVAIAVGLYLGWQVMDSVSPDLPGADVGPGLSSSSDPGAVAGDDPDSLFRPANLAPALAELDDQIAAGEGVSTLHIEPGKLSAETASGEGPFAPSDVAPGTPQRIAAEIHRMRAPVTLADVGYMDLVATGDGPKWYVQLDIDRTDVPPPWTYGAPLAGAPLSVGGPPPTPIGG